MSKKPRAAMLIPIGLLLLSASGSDQATSFAADDAATTQGADVTLSGNVITNHMTGESEQVPMLYVLDGPPDIKAKVDKLLSDTFSGKSLGAEAAESLQDQFTQQLKYYITPGPTAEKIWKLVQWGSRTLALTGRIEEKDGKKWLHVNRFTEINFHYPAAMLAPDKPLVTSDRTPLELKINDTVSLKCIYIPPGQFFMGAPYYQCPRWQEDPPHRVTLTKPFYLAEIDVTQQIYEAVVGNNPSPIKIPTAPVCGIYSPEMHTFCKLFSAKTGHKVRLPTNAEWEYAARVGTSNPTFWAKFQDQYSGKSEKPGVLMSAKSKPPNAWGLYDMPFALWELVSDGTRTLDTVPEVDPQHPPREELDDAIQRPPQDHVGKGFGDYPISEMEYLHPGNGSNIRFRVVVEVKAPATQAK